MLTIPQQDSLIAFVTSHKTLCDCKICFDSGGVKHFFGVMKTDRFTDNSKRKTWSWLKIQFEKHGSCYLADLDFSDVLAPKFSEFVTSYLDSLPNYEEDYTKLMDEYFPKKL